MTTQQAQSRPAIASAQSPARSSAPAPLRRTLAIVGFALVASTVLTLTVASPKREKFQGHLFAEKAVLKAPTDGKITAMNVRAGLTVIPNLEAFVIGKPNLKAQQLTVEKELQRLEADLCSARAKAQVESAKVVDLLESQIFALEDALSIHIAERYLEKMRAKAWGDNKSFLEALASNEFPLVGVKPLSSDALDAHSETTALLKQAEAENKDETLHARIDLCQKRLTALRLRHRELPKQYEVAARVPQIQQALNTALAREATLKSAASQESVKVPCFGITGHVDRQIGDEVKFGDVLVEVFDRDREYLEASIPSRFAATLKPGDTVQVYFPDHQDREGQIESIPSQTHQSQTGEAEIRVRILPVGKVWPYLPIGSAVQVSLK